MKIVEAETVQCSAIRTLFESLKEILTDTNIRFDQKGIKILAMDGCHVALVQLRLFKEKFEKYVCVHDHFTVGVNILTLHKLLKVLSNKDDFIRFEIDSDSPNTLQIFIHNNEKNSVTKYEYKLLDIDEGDLQIDPQEFDSIITMPAVDFQSYCRQMNAIGPNLEIVDYKKQLTLRCEGDFASQETVLTEKLGMKDGEEIVQGSLHYKHEGNQDQIIRGKFSLKFLTMFTKATNLCTTVELYLKNDFPLIIRYTVANLGELKFALTPINEESYY